MALSPNTLEEREHSIYAEVSRIVRALMSIKGMQQKDLAERMHTTQPTVSDKLTGRSRWTLEEIAILGEIFDVGPGTFFEDPDALIRSRCSSHLGLVEPVEGQMELALGLEVPDLARAS